MTTRGWKQLLSGKNPFRGAGKYPIAAYSEFMPPPRLGRKPYGHLEGQTFSPDYPWGWHVTEYEERLELQPGLQHLAGHFLLAMHHLGRGDPAHGISRSKLAGNLYWPEELQQKKAPGHERYVALLPVALSRSQDDK